MSVGLGVTGNFTTVALYPSGSYTSDILTSSAGGQYSPEERMANNTGAGNATNAVPIFLPSELYGRAKMNGTQYYEFLRIESAELKEDVMNVTIFAVEQRKIALPNGSSYVPQIGTLGLGQISRPDLYYDNTISILKQLKSFNTITSNTFGLHMGSAWMNQSGSLILGGYEQNRALGNVGIFDLVRGIPVATLVDVTLGVEMGGSPFNDLDVTKDRPTSLWQGLGDDASGARLAKMYGSVSGSTLVTIDSTLPSIYLPLGNCEAIAKHIPVTWRDDIGYYTWNTTDPQYERIINSPSYLGFILSDRFAKNLTVKIPFALLNLTLETPIVDTPTRYFPCQPSNSTVGLWHLGRTFLQGAFLAITYEKNLFFVAQGPGPDLEQSVIQTIAVDHESIKTNPAASFVKTWQSKWTVLPETNSEHGLSGGAIAGIVVGVLITVAVTAIIAFAYWKKRSTVAKSANVGPDEEEKRHGGKETCHEAPGVELRHEFAVPHVTHEVPAAAPQIHELPVKWIELPLEKM